ncbi:MAG: aminotransferase class I/II-fold pyridoxal phosphate-dependent enzyme [Euryarchaeota archaeon]|nr:aminotransferase class I/II-fold pyridoxal phosphate-dependent enzyme [Euryarchaeota archaeon]
MRMNKAREFRHLTWLKSKRSARHNLGSSSVLSLTLGEVGPLPPAQQVGDAHPAGDPELVELISGTYRAPPEGVLVANGAGEANLHIAMTCLAKGCEVLAERPAYHSLVEVSRFLGARVVHFDRRLEDGFEVDLEQVKARLSQRCRLVILTNHHNPSCALSGADRLRALAEIAADRGARVLCDEVYLDCAGEDAPPPLATVAENAFSVNSLSKAYGAGGFRMGWMIADPDAVRAVKLLRDHTTIAPSRIGEEVAKNILRRRREFLGRTASLTRRNTEAMERWVRSRPDVRWFRPPSGTICFPRILKRTPTVEIAQRYFDREGGLVCPGEFFLKPGYFRVGLGGDPGRFGPALDALGRVLDATG